MLLIGSWAMQYWWIDYPYTPKDIDYLVDTEIQSTSEVEYHTFDNVKYILDRNIHPSVADKDVLYTIKCSHIAWEGKNGKWWKHMRDIVFMQSKGCVIIAEIFDVLYKEWCDRFGDKRNISLNKASEQFFKDGRDRKYNHDWLHEYFKISDYPAYQDMLKTGCDVLCSKQKFDKIPHDRQIYTALEECFVVAFERNLSFAEAYKHLLTKLCKGWYCRFLIDNASSILNLYKHEKQQYMQKRMLLIKEKQL